MPAPLDPVVEKIIPLLPLRDPGTMTPVSAREALRALAAARAEVPPPPVASAENIKVKGAAGFLDARAYRMGTAKAPTVVFFHGGGWVAGDLETHDRLLWYHTTKGEFSVRASLASAEKQLAQYHFSRCNQCYLVNLKYVKAVENDFVHVNTDHLEISRRQRAAFLTAVASYIGGVL